MYEGEILPQGFISIEFVYMSNWDIGAQILNM